MMARAMAFVTTQPITALAYIKMPWLLRSWLLVGAAAGHLHRHMDICITYFTGYNDKKQDAVRNIVKSI